MSLKNKLKQRKIRCGFNQAKAMSNMQAAGRGKHGTQQFGGKPKAAEAAQAQGK